MKLRMLSVMLFALVAFAGSTNVFAADFTYSVVVSDTSLNFNNGMYTNDGSFTVTIVDDVCSAGVYTVNSTPVSNSAPDTSTPPSTSTTTYIGFPDGDFLFGNAGVGEYTLTITQTSSNMGCVNGAQEVSVVTLENPIPPQSQVGRLSSIHTPTPVSVPMVTEPVQQDIADEPTVEAVVLDEEIETTEVSDEEMVEEVMYMDICDAKTIGAYQEILMNQEGGANTTYQDELGNTLTQVKLYLNRYLDRAGDDAEKNQKIVSLVCKIEKTKKARMEAEYSAIDYLLQYIQDIAVIKFVK